MNINTRDIVIGAATALVLATCTVAGMTLSYMSQPWDTFGEVSELGEVGEEYISKLTGDRPGYRPLFPINSPEHRQYGFYVDDNDVIYKDGQPIDVQATLEQGRRNLEASRGISRATRQGGDAFDQAFGAATHNRNASEDRIAQMRSNATLNQGQIVNEGTTYDVSNQVYWAVDCYGNYYTADHPSRFPANFQILPFQGM